ncbi:unnamed protein product, partial [Phaeothamnion confervicola]
RTLDPAGRGSVEPQRLLDGFRADLHPDVTAGAITAATAAAEFAETFEVGAGGRIGAADFAAYYADMSPAYEEDEEFVAVVCGAWGLSDGRSGHDGGCGRAGDGGGGRTAAGSAELSPRRRGGGRAQQPIDKSPIGRFASSLGGGMGGVISGTYLSGPTTVAAAPGAGASGGKARITSAAASGGGAPKSPVRSSGNMGQVGNLLSGGADRPRTYAELRDTRAAGRSCAAGSRSDASAALRRKMLSNRSASQITFSDAPAGGGVASGSDNRRGGGGSGGDGGLQAPEAFFSGPTATDAARMSQQSGDGGGAVPVAEQGRRGSIEGRRHVQPLVDPFQSHLGLGFNVDSETPSRLSAC